MESCKTKQWKKKSEKIVRPNSSIQSKRIALVLLNKKLTFDPFRFAND